MKTQFNCQSNSTKNSGRETHSDEQIEQICFMLQQGYTMAYIANTLKVQEVVMLHQYITSKQEYKYLRIMILVIMVPFHTMINGYLLLNR